MGRAVFEGLCYQTRASVDALTRATGVEAGRVVVMGGGVKNTLWLQTRADALGRGVEVVEDPDVTPRGAAMLAGLGIGLFSDHHDDVARFGPRTVAIEPRVGRGHRAQECPPVRVGGRENTSSRSPTSTS